VLNECHAVFAAAKENKACGFTYESMLARRLKSGIKLKASAHAEFPVTGVFSRQRVNDVCPF